MRKLALVLVASLQAGCSTGIFGVHMPFEEGPQLVAKSAPHITIDDRRPVAERKVHTGGGLSSCQRWYGDDSYAPSKIAYLEHLFAERIPETPVHLQLQRFDTVEFCDNTANRAGAVAATGASGIYIPSKDVPGGDSVLVRLAGDINGESFDVSRRFDYSDLKYNGLTEMPADNATYRERMKRAVVEIVEEIVAKLPKDSVSQSN